MILENAAGVLLNRVNILPNSERGADLDPVMTFINSRDVTVTGSRAFVGIDTFLRIEGQTSGSIRLGDNDLSLAKRPIELARGVPKDAVIYDVSN